MLQKSWIYELLYFKLKSIQSFVHAPGKLQKGGAVHTALARGTLVHNASNDGSLGEASQLISKGPPPDPLGNAR